MGLPVFAVAGDLVQDVVVWQLEPVRRGSDTRSRISIQRGGSAANVAAFAGPLHPTRFIGCAGPDLGGHVLHQELQSHGVDVRLQWRDVTGVIVVMIDPGGERTMFPSRGASTRLEAVDPAWLDGVGLLHVPMYAFGSGTTPAAMRGLVAVAHARGIPVSIDVSSLALIEEMGRDPFARLVAELAPRFVSANADETRALDLGTLPPGATLLARHGGEPTVLVQADRDPVAVAVPPLGQPPRDLTGAGDAFNAGFLTHVLRHPDLLGATPESLVPAVAAGHALAATVLMSPGAST